MFNKYQIIICIILSISHCTISRPLPVPGEADLEKYQPNSDESIEAVLRSSNDKKKNWAETGKEILEFIEAAAETVSKVIKKGKDAYDLIMSAINKNKENGEGKGNANEMAEAKEVLKAVEKAEKDLEKLETDVDKLSNSSAENSQTTKKNN